MRLDHFKSRESAEIPGQQHENASSCDRDLPLPDAHVVFKYEFRIVFGIEIAVMVVVESAKVSECGEHRPEAEESRSEIVNPFVLRRGEVRAIMTEYAKRMLPATE